MLQIVIILVVVIVLGRRLRPYLPRFGLGTDKTYHKSNLPSDAQSAFIVCTFSLLRKLAEVDGRVEKAETQRVKEYASDQLKLGPKESKLAMKVYKDAGSSPLSIQDYADRFAQVYRDRVQLHDRMVKILLEVAIADGAFSDAEGAAIRSVALRLGLSEPGFQRMKRGVAGEERLIH